MRTSMKSFVAALAAGAATVTIAAAPVAVADPTPAQPAVVASAHGSAAPAIDAGFPLRGGHGGGGWHGGGGHGGGWHGGGWHGGGWRGGGWPWWRHWGW